MRKILFTMAAAAAMMSCSIDSPETNDDSNSFDAKANVLAEEESFIVPDQICAGEEAEFCTTFPQKTKGNGEPQTTNVQIQLFDELSDEWIQISKGGADTEYCFSYTFPEATEYQLRYSIGAGGFTELSVMVENCGCEESFDYVENIDGSYTFTYVPTEDMIDAKLTFTFAQSVAVSGLDGWINSGNATSSTETKIMTLDACEVYEWTVSLDKDCSGNSKNSNVWTDFKVNDISKKGDLKNITQECSE